MTLCEDHVIYSRGLVCNGAYFWLSFLQSIERHVEYMQILSRCSEWNGCKST